MDAGLDIWKIPKAEDPMIQVPFPEGTDAVQKLTNNMMMQVWPPTEIDFTEDLKDLSDEGRVSTGLKTLVFGVLAFFARVDGDVASQMDANVSEIVEDYPVLSNAYDWQIIYEKTIHAPAYQRNLFVYVPDAKERSKLMNPSVEEYPSILMKRQWYKRHMNKTFNSVGEVLLAALAMEGICFSGSFAVVGFCTSRKVLDGFCKLNNYVIRDEGDHACLHCAVLQLLKLERRPSQEKMEEIFKGIVGIEQNFYLELYLKQGENKEEALRPELMNTHIKYMCNYWAVKAGYKPVFHRIKKSPFDFWDELGWEVDFNLFEQTSSNYGAAAVLEQHRHAGEVKVVNGIEFAEDDF